MNRDYAQYLDIDWINLSNSITYSKFSLSKIWWMIYQNLVHSLHWNLFTKYFGIMIYFTKMLVSRNCKRWNIYVTAKNYEWMLGIYIFIIKKVRIVHCSYVIYFSCLAEINSQFILKNRWRRPFLLYLFARIFRRKGCSLL